MGTDSPAGPARYLDSNLNPIAYPMMAGYWEQIDFNNNMRTTGHIMVRMIVHPGIEPSEVEFEWMTPTLLKMKFRWPDFFRQVTPMLEFCTTQIGNGLTAPTYSREHALTISFGKFVAERMDDNNEVWDEGYLSFDRPMDQDIDRLDISILEATVGHKKFTCLQITANQNHVPDSPKKKKATVTSRSVRTSSSTGKNYDNVRRRDNDSQAGPQNESEANEENVPQKAGSKKSRSLRRNREGFLNRVINNVSNATHSALTLGSGYDDLEMEQRILDDNFVLDASDNMEEDAVSL